MTVLPFHTLLTKRKKRTIGQALKNIPEELQILKSMSHNKRKTAKNMIYIYDFKHQWLCFPFSSTQTRKGTIGPANKNMTGTLHNPKNISNKQARKNCAKHDIFTNLPLTLLSLPANSNPMAEKRKNHSLAPGWKTSSSDISERQKCSRNARWRNALLGGAMTWGVQVMRGREGVLTPAGRKERREGGREEWVWKRKRERERKTDREREREIERGKDI